MIVIILDHIWLIQLWFAEWISPEHLLLTVKSMKIHDVEVFHMFPPVTARAPPRAVAQRVHRTSDRPKRCKSNNVLKKMKAEFLIFRYFPTCQVRVVRFYHSCSSPPPPRLAILLLLLLLLLRQHLLHHLCLHFHVHCCLANSSPSSSPTS